MAWLDLEVTILSEIRQTGKGKYHMISLICGISKNKKIKKNKQNRNKAIDIENKLIAAKGGREERWELKLKKKISIAIFY